MVSSKDLRAQVEVLRRDFPSFLRDQPQLKYGMKILNVWDANTGTWGDFCSRKSGNTDIMGIMFHGTRSDYIASICRNGIHTGSFTSSFQDAVDRSAYQDHCQKGGKEVKVLAVAVLVEEARKLRSKDQNLRYPHYSLPLFIVTVQT
jgi:hypothetical protein